MNVNTPRYYRLYNIHYNISKALMINITKDFLSSTILLELNISAVFYKRQIEMENPRNSMH